MKKTIVNVIVDIPTLDNEGRIRYITREFQQEINVELGTNVEKFVEDHAEVFCEE